MPILYYVEGINFGKSGQKNPSASQVDDKKIGTGRATLRLRSAGPATVEEEVTTKVGWPFCERSRPWIASI